ncbi:pilus assembly protein CpaB [Modestobacter marinus]|uniref:Pilus assembly protein CpaB n=2 Tax=Modestobacter marinus TaxID=477641 RepID=A0A846LTI0_9ACTN|nr:RcpC/CpaB family pilus assembly protein [Modestobacter marinus]NIH69724.1 pilus assembly protein CpaB [Modestobacter marinus]
MTTMRRVLAALTALALAAFGAFVLVSYVRNADARAAAGAQLVPVLVVDADVPAGTPVADLTDQVSTAQVPARLKATGSLDDLAAVAGLTTTVDLLAGEQVMAARFADPAVIAAAQGIVDLDEGTQEVSLTLELQRAVGAVLAPGDRVGVFVSRPGVDPATSTPTAVTDLAVGDVLVTRVGGGPTGPDAGAVTGALQTVTVTLGLTEADARAVIAGMEQESVWLSLQSAAGSAEGVVTSTTTTNTITDAGADE